MRLMTTDRTAVAPARPTVNQRPSAAHDSASAPSPDAFSALLNAATPKADDARLAPRADDRSHAPRDDAHRPTRSHSRSERGDSHRAHAARRPAAAQATDKPAQPADAEPTTTTGDTPTAPAAGTAVATAPAEAPAAPALAPEIIAAQLNSPLPPQGRPGQAAQGALAPATGDGPTAAVLPGGPAGTPGQPVPGAPGVTDPNAAPAGPADAAQAASTDQPAAAPAQAAAPKLDVPFNLDAPQTATQPADTAAQAAQSAQPAQGTAAKAGAQTQDAAPAVQNTTTAQPLTPPVQPPAQPLTAPAGLQRAVPLQHVARTMGTLLHVATDKGVTHARLNLKPVELGGIEVRLQSTPQGVSAQLVADSPEAARMLTQASDDLRRQLADRNVNLLSLDVSTSSDQRQASAGTGAGNDGSFGEARSGGTSANGRDYDGDAQATEAAPAETTLVLPGGVLVDVLA